MLRTGRASIVSATVSRRGGRWQVVLTVQAADLHPAARHPDGETGPWVGADRGLFAYLVAATATGQEVLREGEAPRPLRSARARLRRLSRQVGRKRKGSANRRKAAARLGRAHAHVGNVRQQFLHQVANALDKTHDRIALEDLNITGVMANHHLAGAIADAAWAELARIVRYKQEWRGGQVIGVDRLVSVDEDLLPLPQHRPAVALSTRVFRCERSGYQADRDLNAAINLAVWAEEHHAQVRDPEVRGPVNNAPRGARRDPHPLAGRGRPHRRRTPNRPTKRPGTPEQGGVP
jgi:putative transposase